MGDVEEINTWEQLRVEKAVSSIRLQVLTIYFMLYGGLSRIPIDLIIHRRMICYWARMISDKQYKLSLLLYKTMMRYHIINKVNYKWISSVKIFLTI